MLTPRQNFVETIKGGSPERFVSQFEYMALVPTPIVARDTAAVAAAPGVVDVKSGWGFTVSWYPGQPGAFPVHKPGTVVLEDITQWRDVVKAPDPHRFTDEDWADSVAWAQSIDRSQRFVSPFNCTGLFEMTHYLMSMEGALMAMIEEPECYKELVDYIADWQIECAKETIAHIHPDLLFQHDDFGTSKNTFFSPRLFEEIFVPAYRRIYRFWKENGVEVVVHHSDCYSETFVPGMIEAGVDVWQGATTANDIVGILARNEGKISIHGGIDSGTYDCVDWSEEALRDALDELLEKTGRDFIIPGFVQGGPISTFPGAYDALTGLIDKASERFFPGFKADSLVRVPQAGLFG